MMTQLTVSSELVPFQEIDVYAKESGYVKDLLVDYGSRVQKGQLMAVLEIPGIGNADTTGHRRHREAAERVPTHSTSWIAWRRSTRWCICNPTV